jgi:translocation and assembly module TamA
MRLKFRLTIGLSAVMLAAPAAADGIDARQTSEPGSAYRMPLAAPPPPPPRVLLAVEPEPREPEPKGEPEVERGDPSDKPANAKPPTKVYAYEVFYNAPKKKLEKKLVEISVLQRKVAEPPLSRAALIRRVESDVALFGKALQSDGYYAYTVEQKIDFAQSPVAISFDIASGPRYTLGQYRIDYDKPDAPGLLKEPSALGVVVGGPATSEQIVEAGPLLLRKLKEKGYPLAKSGKRRAVVNHDEKTLTVVLDIHEGPRVNIGQTFVAGVDRTKEKYVKRVANLDQGDLFDVSKIDAARRRLYQTGLFDGIQINWDDAPDPSGELDVTIVAKERKPRTISLGLNYSTTEGAGADIEWVHRNIFGSDEDLTVTLKAAQIEQSFRTELAAPNWKRLDQRVHVAGEIAREITDTYEEQKISAESGVTRSFGKRWKGSATGVLEVLETTENAVTTQNILAAIPLIATYDGSNDPFDTSKGYKLDFKLEPAAVTLDNTDLFMTFAAGGSVYHDILGDKTLIAAARSRAAFILGPARDLIPASRRLYTGGGGSIRGFEHQSVGPLDGGNDPEGGRSSLEFGTEVRWRITDDIGIVPFIDGGSAFEDPTPDFTDFRFAAGLGLRYYTPIGPLRLDIATPLNPREQDNLFEFYISIGQAF